LRQPADLVGEHQLAQCSALTVFKLPESRVDARPLERFSPAAANPHQHPAKVKDNQPNVGRHAGYSGEPLAMS